MKFYIPSDMLERLEEEEFTWLSEANLNLERKCISRKEFARGWIIEADEGFDTFFTIKTGLQLPVITDQEYNQFKLDDVAFLGKERTRKVHAAWVKFREALDAERMARYR
jgi:hypothetical protein